MEEIQIEFNNFDSKIRQILKPINSQPLKENSKVVSYNEMPTDLAKKFTDLHSKKDVSNLIKKLGGKITFDWGVHHAGGTGDWLEIRFYLNNKQYRASINDAGHVDVD